MLRSCLLLFVAGGAIAAAVPGQPPTTTADPKAPLANAVAPEPVPTDPLPPDPAFDKFVSAELISEAVWNQDPPALADIGLQLIEGERILHRPRKGLTADQVLAFALRAASEYGDKETLERLVRAGKERDRPKLAEGATAALKLAGATRAADPALNVNLDEVTPEGVARMQAILQACREAKVAGDVKALEALEAGLPHVEGLTDTQRKEFAKRITDAKRAAESGGDELVRKLNAASRADPFLGVSAYFDGTGMRVVQVFPNTPASQAGLVPNDVILAVNGTAASDPMAFKTSVLAGGTLNLDLRRPNGTTTTLMVQVAAGSGGLGGGIGGGGIGGGGIGGGGDPGGIGSGIGGPGGGIGGGIGGDPNSGGDIQAGLPTVAVYMVKGGAKPPVTYVTVYKRRAGQRWSLVGRYEQGLGRQLAQNLQRQGWQTGWKRG